MEEEKEVEYEENKSRRRRKPAMQYINHCFPSNHDYPYSTHNTHTLT